MAVILASQSPRRQELLRKIVPEFQVMPADIDETVSEGLTPSDYVQEMAYKKATSILEIYPEATVIGCDTVVVLGDKILGKPKDREEAKQMLMSYSDQTHQVLTGLAILSKEKEVVRLSSAEVTFYPLDEKQVEAYVASDEPMDKSGAYGIQGGASIFVREVRGDFYAIVGFPVGLVNQLLKDF